MVRVDDYYGLLGVEPDAGADEIRRAFRERVRACHPDRVATLDEDLRLLAEEKMVALNEAYAVLRSPSRRTAYDERCRASADARTTDPVGGATARVVPATGGDSARVLSTEGGNGDAHRTGTRGRIGEQHFVTRAASEEFEHTVKRCVPGGVSWAPAAFPGATLALHGRRGRRSMYFVLRAESHFDPRQAQHFLHALRGFANKLGSGLFAGNRLFGFAAAVTFGEQPRQRRILDSFNRANAGSGALQPVTFIDLVNWHVIPGETSLSERVGELLRGA